MVPSKAGDKKTDPLRLVGKSVILEEIQPKYFSYIIEWRNRGSINKYFNYRNLLTLESEKKWYEETYLPDNTQVLLLRIDKETQTPFAASGWVDFDAENKRCIGARLMLGDQKYAGHPAFIEGEFLLSDYIYQMADVVYCHVMKSNRQALHYNKIMGFVMNEGSLQYPSETLVNGNELCELYRTKEMYLAVRKKMFEALGDRLFN